MSFVDDLRAIKAAPKGEQVFLAQKPVWKRQLSDIHHHEKADCAGCGSRRGFHELYRCFFCGILICEACSPEHFGQTREEYFAEQPASEAV